MAETIAQLIYRVKDHAQVHLFVFPISYNYGFMMFVVVMCRLDVSSRLGEIL